MWKDSAATHIHCSTGQTVAIAVRKAHRTFGRGTLRFLRPGNRKILAYLREYEGETILCVANLARVPRRRWNWI